MTVKKEQEQDDSREAKLRRKLNKYMCCHETAGRRCQLLGMSQLSENKYLCFWHSEARPEHYQDYDAFVVTREDQRKDRDKTWFNVQPYVDDVIVWKAIQGKITYKEYSKYFHAMRQKILDEMAEPQEKNNTFKSAGDMKSFSDIDDLPF